MKTLNRWLFVAAFGAAAVVASLIHYFASRDQRSHTTQLQNGQPIGTDRKYIADEGRPAFEKVGVEILPRFDSQIFVLVLRELPEAFREILYDLCRANVREKAESLGCGRVTLNFQIHANFSYSPDQSQRNFYERAEAVVELPCKTASSICFQCCAPASIDELDVRNCYERYIEARQYREQIVGNDFQSEERTDRLPSSVEHDVFRLSESQLIVNKGATA